MRYLILIFSLFFCFFFPQNTFTQTSQFDLDQYVQFLEQHKNMAQSQLLEMHPAGIFNKEVTTSWNSALYHDSIEIKYNLTDYEKTLLNKHGFVVTERLQSGGFGIQFLDIWEKDLPVFISTDAILHAFHLFYDKMLMQVESGVLIDRVTDLLLQMHTSLPDLDAKYSANEAMDQMLKDVDIYLTVAILLLEQDISPVYSENLTQINSILELIYAEKMANYPFFSETCKEIDFSQFKPRGHYARDGTPYGTEPRLPNYFRAMIWLGRIEIYLLAPESITSLTCPLQTDADIQRQTIDALLVSELIELSAMDQTYEEIEEILEFFVGGQDNVTLHNLRSLLQSLNLTEASQLLDDEILQTFQDSLKSKPFASQKILSQILKADPFSPESIQPASAFMLFGQRFVIDSYVTGSVVYDRIIYNQNKICRLFPSTLDILFALGNDASAQLLTEELESYHYSSNLAALRYLIDHYQDDFWTGSIYNMWLKTIRQLNTPSNRQHLPQFMQTGAWWQQKMNTQLSSWTELRHDNLLYAKQSYTGAVDMAIISTKDATGQLKAYVGPVSSYHSYVTTNFLRLTDSEWKETYLEASTRPDLVNIYLADKSGETRGSGASLVVGIDNHSKDTGILPSTNIFAKNYPNPFNATTIINFVIPAGLTDYFTELTIYNIQGKVIKKLIARDLPPGNYLTRWDATDTINRRVASGIYFYELKVGGIKYTGKMNLVK